MELKREECFTPFSNRKGVSMQMDFFKNDAFDQLYQELQDLRLSTDKMRKSLFARHNELSKLVGQLQQELSQVKQISANKKAELVPFFGDYIEVTK